jgi:Protein of unknown function (DUF3386)
MTRTCFMLALMAPALVLSLSAVRADDDTRARKMMEEAFNRRYRWDDGFRGFSADFSFTREGKTVKGTVHADATKPHGGVTAECDDADVKKLVSDTVASTVTHTRASSFEKGFGSCSFAIAGDGIHGGTKIALTGHGFFKDFTVKDGNIIENHGGHDALSTEVKVQQVIWLANSGKTLPRAYAFTIKNGDHEQAGRNVENWRKIEAVWLPVRWHMIRNEGSAAAVESTLTLANVKLE